MASHYLESAIFSFAHAVARDEISKAAALDILNDQHSCGHDDAQKPLCLDICHDSNICASHYEFDNIESAFDAALDNIAEFED